LLQSRCVPRSTAVGRSNSLGRGISTLDVKKRAFGTSPVLYRMVYNCLSVVKTRIAEDLGLVQSRFGADPGQARMNTGRSRGPAARRGAAARRGLRHRAAITRSMNRDGLENRRLASFSFAFLNGPSENRGDCAQNCAQSRVAQTSNKPTTQTTRVAALSVKSDGLNAGRLRSSLSSASV